MKDDLLKTIKDYIFPATNDNNHRFKSWEHCYKIFEDPDADIDLLSLNLSFYLASWGMYRGSSGLLWKDYQVHGPAIEIIKKYLDLREFNMDKKKIERIICLKNELSEYYKKVEFNNGKELKNFSPTDTLLSKIIMGTIGCLPAFDRYFNQGFREKNTLKIQKEVIEKIIVFYEENSEMIKECQKYIESELNFRYPEMKIIDMYYWQKGFIKPKMS